MKPLPWYTICIAQNTVTNVYFASLQQNKKYPHTIIPILIFLFHGILNNRMSTNTHKDYVGTFQLLHVY